MRRTPLPKEHRVPWLSLLACLGLWVPWGLWAPDLWHILTQPPSAAPLTSQLPTQGWVAAFSAVLWALGFRRGGNLSVLGGVAVVVWIASILLLGVLA